MAFQSSWQSALFISLCHLAFLHSPTTAQLIPDTTLGTENSIVTPQNLIQGGAIRDSTLFHSFLEFNVNNNQQVYFANPNGIANILTRVTGTNASNILGTLGINGAANLFLINPNGILFGPNATLDLSGSFTASTAESLIFDNYSFSATNPTPPPLLTIKVTPGIQWGSNHPSRQIESQGNLSVGQDLNLIGGTLNLTGQLQAGNHLNLIGDTVRIRDRATNPFIAAAGGKLLLQGNQTLDIFALNHPDSGLFSGSHMTLRSDNIVGGDAHYNAGGNFRIEQLDGTLGSLYSPNDPIIRALGDVSFTSYQGASLHILAGGQVNIGAALITGTDTVGNSINPTNTPNLANVPLSDGSTVAIDGSTRPTLDIRAGMNPVDIGIPGITGTGFFFPAPPNTASPATGTEINVGSVLIEQPNGQVLLTNQYRPNLNLAPGDINVSNILVNPTVLGNGGDVILDARGGIAVSGQIETSAFSTNNVFGPYTGNGGSLKLLAQNDLLLNSDTSIRALGLLGGQIDFSSNANISFDTALVLNVSTTRSVPATQVSGGAINIQARNLDLNGSDLATFTTGTANAGDINIAVTDEISMVGSALASQIGGTSFGGTIIAPEGNGGAINIAARTMDISDGSLISGNTAGTGNGANITINLTETLNIDGNDGNGIFRGAGIASNVGGIDPVTNTVLGGEGTGGTIEINADSIILANGAGIAASTGGVGNAGEMTLNARSVSLTNGGLIEGSTSDRGNGGNIDLNVSENLVVDGSTIASEVLLDASGNGGKIAFNARSVSLTNGGLISASTFGVGNGGEIAFNARSVSLTNGGSIFGSTFGQGNGGNILLNVSEQLLVDGSGIVSEVFPDASGDGGEIAFNARSVSLTNGGLISGNTFGQGNGGNIDLNVSENLVVDGSKIASEVSLDNGGNGGEIAFNAGSVSLTNGGVISGSTFGQGNGGNISGNISNALRINGEDRFGNSSGIVSLQFGNFSNRLLQGDAGNIDLNAGSVSLTEGGIIAGTTFGRGDAGRIRVSATGAFEADGASSLGNASAIFSQVSSGAAGNVRGIELNANWVKLTNGGRVAASTNGIGNAGRIQISATESIEIDGQKNRLLPAPFFDNGLASGIYSQVGTEGVGNAGGIELDTASLSLSNGGTILAATQGRGNAGIATLNATDSIRLNNGSISSAVGAGAIGNAGQLNLNTRILSLSNNAQLTSGTSGRGNGGAIAIQASDSINLSNQSRITVGATASAVGNGGNIEMGTGSLQLFDSQILSDNDVRGLGGNIDITTSGHLNMTRSRITTDTASGDGGNINLDLGDRLNMRDNSLISATAGRAGVGGNGGNIGIRATFIFGFPQENSDITANAFNGTGGSIKITTQQIFGLKFRPNLTPLSDITVSSEFGLDGITDFNVRPSPNTIELPSHFTNASERIVAGCPADNGHYLTVSGRGGLPEDPSQPLRGSTVWQDWRNLSGQAGEVPSTDNDERSMNRDRPWVEAQGWVVKADGTIVLTAKPYRGEIQESWEPTTSCSQLSG